MYKKSQEVLHMTADIDSRKEVRDTKKIYGFVIIETLQREVEIKAYDEDDAFDRIDKMYRNAEIILTADDFSDYEINLIDNPDDKEEE